MNGQQLAVGRVCVDLGNGLRSVEQDADASVAVVGEGVSGFAAGYEYAIGIVLVCCLCDFVVAEDVDLFTGNGSRIVHGNVDYRFFNSLGVAGVVMVVDQECRLTTCFEGVVGLSIGVSLVQRGDADALRVVLVSDPISRCDGGSVRV